MSSEERIPSPILFYPYPDSLEKQVMNDLTEHNTISAKQFQGQEIATAVETVLDVFEENGYVTSSTVADPDDGFTHRTWTVTPFYRSRIQAQRDIIADDDAVKLALWNQKNQLLSAISSTPGPNNVRLLKPKTGAFDDDDDDEDDNPGMELTESEINDIIKPELDALKKKMLDEANEKRRLKKRLQEEQEEQEEQQEQT